DDRATAVALQPDGKIVVAGYAAVAAGNYDIAVARLSRADGSLDKSFSGDGLLTIDYSGTTDKASAVKVQNTGRILVAGTTQSATTGLDFTLTQIDPSNGSLDSSLD